MLKLQYAFVCEFYREGTSGKFDALGVFDRVFAKNVPTQHNSLSFVVMLTGDSEDDLGTHKMHFKVRRPNGQVLFEQKGDFKIALNPGGGSWLCNVRFNFVMGGMPLPDYGKYRFTLEIDDNEMAAHPLTVSKPE